MKNGIDSIQNKDHSVANGFTITEKEPPVDLEKAEEQVENKPGNTNSCIASANQTWSRGYENIFMLNSAKHVIFSAHKC